MNQRLATRRLAPLDDVVAEIHKGSYLVDLCEVLSEQAGPKMIATKFRAQELENMTKALKFVFEGCGVQMSLKPSPENLLKGDEKDVSDIKDIKPTPHFFLTLSATFLF